MFKINYEIHNYLYEAPVNIIVALNGFVLRLT